MPSESNAIGKFTTSSINHPSKPLKLKPELRKKSNEKLKKLIEKWDKQTEIELKPYENELPKSEQDLVFISSLAEIFKQELVNYLNIPVDLVPEIIPEQIHFLTEEDYHKLEPTGHGHHDPKKPKSIFINRESRNWKYTLVHELTHYIQKLKVYLVGDDPETDDNIVIQKGVYSVFKQNGETKRVSLIALEEARVDMFTRKLLSDKKHLMMLTEDLGEDFLKDIIPTNEDDPYADYRNLLVTLILRIADKLKLKPYQVMKSCYRSGILGDHKFHRLVKLGSGPGTLLLFSLLGSIFETEDQVKAVGVFIETEDQELKDKIAKHLLNSKAYGLYEAMQNKGNLQTITPTQSGWSSTDT
ncbi:MAG: hypothetical protein OHK0017_13320 [Patescibacteria group bacterium]